MEPTNTRTNRLTCTRVIQNFLLVWLDECIDDVSNDEYHNDITKLRQIINTVNTFTNVDECIDFITGIKEEKIFMIISATLSQIILQIIQDIVQVESVYILCVNKVEHEVLIQQWSKVKGIFTDITIICEALNQMTQDCDQNMVSISFVQSNNGTLKPNLDELDQSFMYTQILKEILLTIDFEEQHISEFLMYCQTLLAKNTIELKNVEKLGKEYHDHQPIWWYTRQSFLYSMLNRALRMMEVDLLIKMGFFIRDLHNQITTLHSEQYTTQTYLEPFTVYRGQGLSQIDFEKLITIQDGLLAFNNFLSTSKHRNVSLKFARRTINTSSLVGVLFTMKIDPKISTTPFANIREVSCYRVEEEILFSMHSVFRIGQAKHIDENNRLWEVELTLTNDDDPQLHALTERMREETYSGCKGWCQLGELLIKLGQLNKAQQIYEILLNQTSNERDIAFINDRLGCVHNNQGKYEDALMYARKAIEIYHVWSPNDPCLSRAYNNIGLVYDKMGQYSRALSYYEKALEITQKILPPNHPSLAPFYNNIGSVYENMAEYSKALLFHEKAIDLNQKVLPPNHPNLAVAYNNIGSLYDKIGEHSKALSYHEKAINIQEKILPPDHPELAASYNNIGSLYQNTAEYSKAYSYYEKAININRKILPPHHPHLAYSYNNIASIHSEMGEYSKALSFHEKVLDIYQNILPPNHPSLAHSYNNIGLVYSKLDDHSKALSYHEKAIDIMLKTLPPNYHDLAACYSSIGVTYDKMNDSLKALSFHEKALAICQKYLPPNHHHLAICYSNIGSVYYSMGQYSKALSYDEKSHEIKQKILPPNHPDLATSYNNIGLAYSKAGEFHKALSSHKTAVEICQIIFPPNHPRLANAYNNFGLTYVNMGEYSKALPYYEKALEIQQNALHPSHSSLADSYNSIGVIYHKLNDSLKALHFFERALDILQHLLPTDHPKLLSTRKNIEFVKQNSK